MGANLLFSEYGKCCQPGLPWTGAVAWHIWPISNIVFLWSQAENSRGAGPVSPNTWSVHLSMCKRWSWHNLLLPHLRTGSSSDRPCAWCFCSKHLLYFRHDKLHGILENWSGMCYKNKRVELAVEAMAASKDKMRKQKVQKWFLKELFSSSSSKQTQMCLSGLLER